MSLKSIIEKHKNLIIMMISLVVLILICFSVITNKSAVNVFVTISAILVFYLIVIYLIIQKVIHTISEKNRENELILRGISQIFLNFVLCDLKKNQFKYVNNSSFFGTDFPQKGTYENFIDFLCSHVKNETEADELQNILNLKNIYKSLDKNVSYLRFEIETDINESTWYHLLVICVGRKNGYPTKVLFTFQDITAMKNEESQYHEFLNETVTASEKASSAKNTFLSNMSHDIRTPMNAIIGMAELAQLNINNKDVLLDNITKINLASKQLLNIINQILDLTKIEAGNFILTEDSLSLPAFMDEIVSLYAGSIKNKGIKFEISTQHVQHETFTSDPEHLKQIISNLIDNAVKYTQSGGKINVLISEEIIDDSRSMFEFVVEDTGIGMEQEVAKHIFDPFYRQDSKRNTKIAGTGIGMAITKNMVSMMDGTIMVESAPGKGSKFFVRIPIKTVQFSEVHVTDELKDVKILILDSSKKHSSLTAKLLGEIGAIPTEIEDSLQAKELIQSGNKFDLILINNNIPDARMLKDTLGTACPKILMALNDRLDIPDDKLNYNGIIIKNGTEKKEISQMGFDALIIKPLYKSRLAEVINNLLNYSAEITITDNDAKMLEEKTEPQPNNGATLKDKADFTGKKILVVEDNDLNAEIAKGILQMMGIEVEIAEDGQIGYERLKSMDAGYYDLVFMDIKMPNMNGYEATSAIRACDREDLKSIPIIAMTADTFTEDIQHAFISGMNDHISKPLDINRLITILESYLK